MLLKGGKPVLPDALQVPQSLNLPMLNTVNDLYSFISRTRAATPTLPFRTRVAQDCFGNLNQRGDQPTNTQDNKLDKFDTIR